MAKNEKCRVALDFPDQGALLEWVEGVKQAALLPEDAVVFVQDSLDNRMPSSRTFIVKHRGDRDERFQLRADEPWGIVDDDRR